MEGEEGNRKAVKEEKGKGAGGHGNDVVDDDDNHGLDPTVKMLIHQLITGGQAAAAQGDESHTKKDEKKQVVTNSPFQVLAFSRTVNQIDSNLE